jgi:hypothetical protein
MPQLHLNFTDIPIPETCLWEQFDDEQKRIVIETLARLLVQATRDNPRSRPMTDPSKVKLSHTQRAACVYVRQSTPGQVEHNRESTARQYALAERACQLGWPKEQVVIIDEDLGLSGSSSDKRSGFARLTSEVALAHVGIVLGLEVSRLARNNADWYRLLELCGITDTLIGDNDGVTILRCSTSPAGLKGTMSEAEFAAPVWMAAATRRHGRWAVMWWAWLRTGWRSPVSSGRSRHQRHPHRVRAFRRIRLSAAGLALVSIRRFIFSTANDACWYAWPDPLGRSDLSRTPSNPHQSGVCWRLYLRQDPLRTLRR